MPERLREFPFNAGFTLDLRLLRAVIYMHAILVHYLVLWATFFNVSRELMSQLFGWSGSVALDRIYAEAVEVFDKDMEVNRSLEGQEEAVDNCLCFLY